MSDKTNMEELRMVKFRLGKKSYARLQGFSVGDYSIHEMARALIATADRNAVQRALKKLEDSEF
jgi:hypothetical protein